MTKQHENGVGHNSNPELTRITRNAKRGLAVIAEGEARSVEGWLIYGAALNEGRKQFPSNEEFGQWVCNNLLQTEHRPDRAAAMWAAENEDLMKQIMADNPRIKTVRGAHAKAKAKEKDVPKTNMKEETAKIYEVKNTIVFNMAIILIIETIIFLFICTYQFLKIYVL